MSENRQFPPEPQPRSPAAPPPRDGEDDTPLGAVHGDPGDRAQEPGPTPAGAAFEPLRLAPLLPRRQSPWLVVDVDASPESQGALVWALREAARREATVVAVSVVDEAPDGLFGSTARAGRRERDAALDRLEAQVLRAIAETGIHGRTRTAVLERPVFEALSAAGRGADLVVVGAHGKTLLRPATPRSPARRLARGA